MAAKKRGKGATRRKVYPFQASAQQIAGNIEAFIDVTIGSLSSFYLELPRGEHFLEYEDFRQAYETLRNATNGFRTLDRHAVRAAVQDNSLILVC